MNDLFARLYLDEDVNPLVAKMLRAEGFDVTTVHDVHRFGMTDEQQLQYAVDIGAALVTHNRVDFERLAEQWRRQHRSHWGIIIGVQRPARIVADRLTEHILNVWTADEIRDQVLYL